MAPTSRVDRRGASSGVSCQRRLVAVPARFQLMTERPSRKDRQPRDRHCRARRGRVRAENARSCAASPGALRATPLMAAVPALAAGRDAAAAGPRAPASTDRPRYDRRVSSTSAPATSRPGAATPSRAGPRRPHAAAASLQQLRRTFLRVRNEIRLTALAIWRGIVGVYNSDDLTFAASIAYYSLLSLFPFFLLLLSLIASVTSSDADRPGSARLRAALFSAAVRLRDRRS